MAFARYIREHGADEVEMDYLDIMVEQGRDAVDVGANLGRYSNRLANLAKQVWAFEPHPRLTRILKSSLPRNVIVTQAAVSNRRGTVDLRVPLRRNQQIESLGTLESIERDPHRTISVKMITLDTLSAINIGFIKIDVEGHEISVIEGARQLLAEQRPIILIEADEHHRPNTTADLRGLMERLGYQGLFILQNTVRCARDFDPSTMQRDQDLAEGVPRNKCPYVNNFIFAPKGDAFYSLRERLLFRTRLTCSPTCSPP